MEGLIIFLVVLLVALPVAIIVALIGHGSKIRRLDETNDWLRNEVVQLRARLKDLETHRTSVGSSAPPTKSAPAVESLKTTLRPADPPVPAAQGIEAVPPPLPPATEWIEEVSTASAPVIPKPVHPEPSPAWVPPIAPVFRKQEPPKPAFNLEQFMGVKLFAWIGGLALFLGVAFFVKYSFDHNLIPPEVRVAIGFLIGIALIVGGVLLSRKDYKVTAHTLCATGIVSLYGVTFACRSIYHFPFFGPVPTLILMVLVTTAAFTLAVRLNAIVVAVLGLLGGFLTPLLLSTRVDNPGGLFGYIALLDIGLLAVVLHRRWNFLVALAAGGTFLMQVGWLLRFFERERYFDGDRVLVAMAVFLGFGVLFAAATWFVEKRKQSTPWVTLPTLLLLLAAGLVTGYFMEYAPLAERPGLLFGYLLLVDLAAIGLVWLKSDLRRVLPVAGGVVFGLFGYWLMGPQSEAMLPWGLGFTFVFALLHSLLPILLQRLRPELVASNWVHAFPPLALLLVMVPLVRFESVPWALWPLVFLIDAMALVLAVATASLMSVLAVLLLSLILVATWIGRVPVSVGMDFSPMPILLVLGLVVVFFAVAGKWLAKRLAGAVGDGTSPLRMSPELAARLLPAFAGGLPFLLLLLMTLRLPMPHPSPVFGLALALVVLMLGVARSQAVAVLPAVALGCTLALEYVWQGFRFDAAVNGWETLAWQIGFSLLFGAFPFVFAERFREQALPWIVAALAGVLHFHLIYLAVGAVAPNSYMGLVPALMAMPALVQLVLTLRVFKDPSPKRLEVLAWMGGAVLFFITLIFPIQFDKQWLTVAWALEGAALCWLFQRVPHPGLRLVGFGLLIVSFVRLALNPAVLSYHARSGTPLLNWYLYAYGLVIAALFVAAKLLAPPRDRVLDASAPPVLRALGTVLVFLLVNIQIADYFSEPGDPSLTFQFHGNFARDMTYTIAWALFALGLLIIGLKRGLRPARYAALALLSATLLKLFFHDLARLDALYRIVALIVVAVVAILASFIYQKSLSHEAAQADPPNH